MIVPNGRLTVLFSISRNYDAALQVMGRATIPSKQKNIAFHDEVCVAINRIYIQQEAFIVGVR
jgi:hypothetical protein